MPKKEFKYEITEILGELSPDSGIHSNWCKAVLKTLLNETEDGIDIRRYNKEENNLSGGKGIRLTMSEANELADILIKNGYGSIAVIEEEYNRRRSMYE